MGAVKNHFHDEICAMSDGPDYDDSAYEVYCAEMTAQKTREDHLAYIASIPDPHTRSKEQQAKADELDWLAILAAREVRAMRRTQ